MNFKESFDRISAEVERLVGYDACKGMYNSYHNLSHGITKNSVSITNYHAVCIPIRF